MVDERSRRIESVGYRYDLRATEPVRVCNLCGSSTQTETARRDRYGFPARLQVCLTCGLGFLDPRLTADEYAVFYAEFYRPLVSAYHGRLIDASTVQVEQREYASELVPFLRGRLESPPASVLDLGGSTGVVGAAVAEAFGAAATVVDPSPAELAVAAQAGLETIAGFAEDFEPGRRRWDLILVCQTLDHLLDVGATLRTVRRALDADAHAFVDILDVEFVLERTGAIESAVKIDHPFYLTRPTARAFFCRAGLRVVSERLSDDGHRAFLLAPAAAEEPDWAALRRHAERFVERIARLRARTFAG